MPLDLDWSRVDLFADIPPAQLPKLKAMFSLVSLGKNEAVLTEGQAGDEMYVLIEGRVRVTKSMLLPGMHIVAEELSNSNKTLATLEAKEHFPVVGELALLDQDLRSATVRTLSECRFLVTTRERFFRLVRQEPELGALLLAALGKRLTNKLRRANTEVVKLTTALALALTRKPEQ